MARTELLDRILNACKPGTEIPKPRARSPFTVKGEGRRRGERALIYRIPNHARPAAPREKGITASELDRARDELLESGHLTLSWFNEQLPGCAREGACNVTTVGGLLVLLGEAEYSGSGVYRRRGVPRHLRGAGWWCE